MNESASTPPMPEISNPYAAPGAESYMQTPVPETQDERNLGMLCHLLGIFAWFVGPLLIWLTQKDKSAYVEREAKEALNWQITVMLGIVVSALLMIIAIGALLLPLVMICNIIFCVMGTLKAKEGQSYTYPFALRLLK